MTTLPLPENLRDALLCTPLETDFADPSLVFAKAAPFKAGQRINFFEDLQFNHLPVERLVFLRKELLNIVTAYLSSYGFKVCETKSKMNFARKFGHESIKEFFLILTWTFGQEGHNFLLVSLNNSKY